MYSLYTFSRYDAATMPEESTQPDDRRELFENWAPNYDNSIDDIAQAENFPFAGYDQVMDGICQEMTAEPGMSVLDIGTGTGNLARRVLDLGCRVCGTDLSASMLEKAREKIPEATLLEADLRESWPSSIDGPYDRIVSAFVLHEFDLKKKISILLEAAQRLSPGGKIVIGDVAFPTHDDFERAHQRWHDRWDETEHYWVAETALEAAQQSGLLGRWIEVSTCAGIFIFQTQTK